MKAKELMIGDWVHFHLGDYANPQGVVNFKIRDCFDLARYADFRPIPLTPEILKKNGFKIGYGEHSGNEGLIDDVNKHYYIKVTRWNPGKNAAGHCEVWNACIDQHSPIYVHEVQHSLRQCRQYELADNFKV